MTVPFGSLESEGVLKLIPGMLTMAILTTACAGGNGPNVPAAVPGAETAASTPPSNAAPEPPPTAAPTPDAGSPRAPRETPARRQARTESAPVTSAAPAVSDDAPPSAPEYREFVVPAGTALALELKSTIASDTSGVEDPVRATLRRSVTVNGQHVLPVGTELAGHVIDAERSGRVKGRARVAFRFTTLRYDGERLALRTDPIVREAEATKGEDATTIGVGAGAGAALGAVVGGKSGAAKGAALGGAAGTGVVLATRGTEVRLEQGTELAARLAAPLTIRVRVP